MERRKPRFFYGWVIVAAMFASGVMAMAMGTLNFGLFIRPMGDELGFGRAIFGWANTARQVSGALTAPLVGRLLDRVGGRWLLAFAATVSGLALIGVAHVAQGWQLVLLFGAMGLVGLTGPGALVTTVPVAKWFVQKRGRALALASMGTPVGGVIFVPLTQVFIDNFGWRNAWMLLAALGVGVIVPIALIFVRRQPEDMGLLPDGGPAAEGRTPGARARAARLRDEVSWTPQEAMRSGAFWRLAAVFAIAMLAISSVAVHRIPHFMDRGLDATLVSIATALDAALAGVSIFLMGFFAERVTPRYLGAAAFVFIGVGVYLTLIAHSPAVMFLSTGFFGFGIGAHLLLMNYMWAEYFGRKHLGAIRGWVNPMILLFSAMGSPVAGYVRDGTGSYNTIWWGGIVLLGVGAVAIIMTGPPGRPAGSPPSSPVSDLRHLPRAGP